MVQTPDYKKFTLKLETYGAIALGFTIVFYITRIQGQRFTSLSTIMTLTNFALIGFFVGFLRFKSESPLLSNVFYKIHGFGMSVCFIDILLYYQKYPFPYKIVGLVSFFALLISLVLGVLEVRKGNENKINWRYFARIVIALLPLTYIIIYNKWLLF